MRLRLSPTAKFLLCACCFILASRAVTLDELEKTPDLTPQKFARFFSDFEFKYHDDVQSAETFLATESGDCDDYAVLAARVFKSKGYTPRLIAVRMPKLVHVVCCIEETRSYLDYNNRSFLSRTVNSSPDLRVIAQKVAKSYHAKWSSASEFTFEEGAKRLVQTVVEPRAGEQQVAALSR